MKATLTVLTLSLISLSLSSCAATRQAADTTHDAASVARDVWDITRIFEAFKAR